MKIKGPQINFTNCKITFEFELLTDIQKWKVKPNWWIHGISEQNTKKKKSTTCPRKRKINLTKQEKWLIHKLESRLVKYYMKTKYSIFIIFFQETRVRKWFRFHCQDTFVLEAANDLENWPNWLWSFIFCFFKRKRFTVIGNTTTRPTFFSKATFRRWAEVEVDTVTIIQTTVQTRH
jgi:hypothetical protein